LVKQIPLTQGKVAIIDDEDFERVARIKWCYSKSHGYASGKIPYEDGTYSKAILMHRYLLNVPKDKVTDHINLDKLDNRKANLRICTRGENNRNMKIRSTNKSGYKGVYPHYTGRFQVHVRHEGKSNYVGLFDDPEEAALFYNFWAFDLHGEYANVNDRNGKKSVLVNFKERD
jgi:hypothetical protein